MEVSQRARLLVLLNQSIVPHEVHAFSRSRWVVKETEQCFRIWCSLDDMAISRPILLNRYELIETKFLERNVREGDFVIDAGANIGYHALHLAKLVGANGCVEAFEPLPYLADALEASIAENNFGARVKLHRLALVDGPGSIALRHAPRTANFGGAHLVSKIDGTPPAGHADLDVSTVRIDDIAHDGRCRLIKLDVEGAEPRIIRGAQRILKTARPTILSELHNAQLRKVSDSSATEFISMMSGYRYRCFTIDKDGRIGSRITRYDDELPLNVAFEAE